ncbi:MAG: DUF4432 family protein [Chloroflexota bacterium]
MGGYFRNHGCRIMDFTLAGYRALLLENEPLRVIVLVDKGACIYEILHKPSDTSFLWRWERGLRPRDSVASTPHPRGSFQEYFCGGWDEMFPVFGAGGTIGGLPIGQNGEVSSVPWEYAVERDDPDEVAIRFFVRTWRSPFRLTRRLRLRRGQPTLFVDEEVTNEAALAVPFVWGHHITYGAPFLSGDCHFDTGGRRVLTFAADARARGRLAVEDQQGEWPYLKGRDGARVDLSRLQPFESGLADTLFVTDFDDTAWYAVTNQATRTGICLSWPKEVMPCLVQWQGAGGNDEAPWWGRAHALGAHPLSSLPMSFAEAERQGTVLRLGAGQSLRFALAATAYVGATGVSGVAPNGAVLTR